MVYEKDQSDPAVPGAEKALPPAGEDGNDKIEVKRDEDIAVVVDDV